jgi:hypothetical protein
MIISVAPVLPMKAWLCEVQPSDGRLPSLFPKIMSKGAREGERQELYRTEVLANSILA